MPAAPPCTAAPQTSVKPSGARPALGEAVQLHQSCLLSAPGRPGCPAAGRDQRRGRCRCRRRPESRGSAGSHCPTVACMASLGAASSQQEGGSRIKQRAGQDLTLGSPQTVEGSGGGGGSSGPPPTAAGRAAACDRLVGIYATTSAWWAALPPCTPRQAAVRNTSSLSAAAPCAMLAPRFDRNAD